MHDNYDSRIHHVCSEVKHTLPLVISEDHDEEGGSTEDIKCDFEHVKLHNSYDQANHM